MKKIRRQPSGSMPASNLETLSRSVGFDAPVLPETPLADLMLHPEKIDALLEGGQGRTSAQDHAPNAKITQPTAPQSGARPPKPARKTTSFHFRGHAKSVQLAGDFTGWEKSPINLISNGHTQWSTSIPLDPGHHAYKFIVDGQWCTDPSCGRRVDNSFGGENSVIEVS